MVSNGQVALLGQLNGPVSFYQACRDICPKSIVVNPKCGTHNQQKTKQHRKKKLVKELGTKKNNNLSYFSCIAPKNEKKEVMVPASGAVSDNSISTGESFICLSYSESDIIRCNNRLVGKSEVGLKVLSFVSDLGVVSKRPDSVIENLILKWKGMIRRD